MIILSKFMHWDNQTQAASCKGKFLTASNDLSYTSTEGEDLGDDEILHLLFNASNGRDNLKLYNGDTSKYNDDQSAADLAFVNSIAFYTQLPKQIDSIFRQSKLVRDKWDEQHSSTEGSYGEMTINKALADLNNTYVGSSQKQTKQKGFEFIDGRQLLERPMQTEWLIENFIPSDATVMLFGAPASGKSLIALKMAVCIVSGNDWYDHPVKQGGVAYIAGEGFNGITKRFQVLVKDKDIPVENFHCSKAAMDLFDEESSLSVLSAIQSMKDLRLIIVDTLHRNFSGDENQSSNFAIALKHCDRLRNATGATIILVHHSGHKSSDRGRGSSSMNGAMDAEFKVSKPNQKITLTCTKMKDDEKPKDIKFDLKSVPIAKDEDGKAITAPLLQKSTTFFTADNSSATLNQTDRLTLDTLTQLSTKNNDPVSKADWKAACMEKYTVASSEEKAHQAKSKKFSRSLNSLLDKGVIVDDNGCFTVADPDATTGEDDE